MDWDDDLKETERKDQLKEEDNYSACSDWDADLKEQDRKNQEIKDQNNSEGKTPQNNPALLSATTFTLQPPESSFEHFTKMSSEIPTEEET